VSVACPRISLHALFRTRTRRTAAWRRSDALPSSCESTKQRINWRRPRASGPGCLQTNNEIRERRWNEPTDLPQAHHIDVLAGRRRSDPSQIHPQQQTWTLSPRRPSGSESTPAPLRRPKGSWRLPREEPAWIGGSQPESRYVYLHFTRTQQLCSASRSPCIRMQKGTSPRCRESGRRRWAERGREER
jgi:hypothetical protein